MMQCFPYGVKLSEGQLEKLMQIIKPSRSD